MPDALAEEYAQLGHRLIGPASSSKQSGAARDSGVPLIY